MNQAQLALTFEPDFSAAHTRAVVRQLKQAQQDFEFYPSTHEQIQLIVDDVTHILKTHRFHKDYIQIIKILDVGAGDGRVLHQLSSSISALRETLQCESYAIEKAPLQIASYRKKGIELVGTEFNEINFLSKQTDLAFTNPPYQHYAEWLSTLIEQLSFKLMYAIVPERWKDNPRIQNAIAVRGVSFETIATSHFHDADRQARGEVHLVRFFFNDFETESEEYYQDMAEWENSTGYSRSRYVDKVSLGMNQTDPFTLFIRNELGLKQTYSETSRKFDEEIERERVEQAMANTHEHCHELVEHQGVLAALLFNYEQDLKHCLDQYRKISELDPTLLHELDVDYNAMKTYLKERLLGYRCIYWSLLFDRLDVLTERLTQDNKSTLLNTLKNNSMDFTETNAKYVIAYAVEMANELIEDSLISVFKEMTNKDSIQRYYVSNEHVYSDHWRYNATDTSSGPKYVLDYRFITSHRSNFTREGVEKHLITTLNDLAVVFRLLGYSDVVCDAVYEELEPGDTVTISGKDPEAHETVLLKMRIYKNGNRHLQFNQQAMLRFNVTVSRLLKWVRSKDEFEVETEQKTPISDAVWHSSDHLRVPSTAVLKLIALNQ